jgi:hypothetical protein
MFFSWYGGDYTTGRRRARAAGESEHGVVGE